MRVVGFEHEPFVRRGGRIRSFLAFGRGDEAQGRVTAMLSPWLRTADGRALGLVGLWECVDDPVTAKALLDAALRWLRVSGVARVVGPLDFSTWYRYRFATDGHEHGPFLLDTYHRSWYARQFEGAGFTPFRTYGFTSNTVTKTTLDPAGNVVASATRAVSSACDGPAHALWLWNTVIAVLSCNRSNVLETFAW
jgi:hypothetical protein